MAKITCESPVKYIQGKITKSDSNYFAVRYGKTFLHRLINPSNPFVDGTEEQKSNIERFREAQAAVSAAYLNAEQMAVYEAGFKKQTKYKTLRGYIFAQLY